MGTDITLFVEVKTKNGWELYHSPDIGRYYDMFSKMAGIRGWEDPITHVKGMPSNLSLIVNEAYKEDTEHPYSCVHEESWLNAEEILELSNWLAENDLDLEEDILKCSLLGESFAPFDQDRFEFINDVRFVFWFDS